MSTRFASLVLATSLLAPQFAEAGKPKVVKTQEDTFDASNCSITTFETVVTGTGKKATTDRNIKEVKYDAGCLNAKEAQRKIELEAQLKKEEADRKIALAEQVEKNKVETERLAAELAAKLEKERLARDEALQKARLSADQAIAQQRLEYSSSFLVIAFQKAVDPGQKTYLAAQIIKGLKATDEATQKTYLEALKQGGVDKADVRKLVVECEFSGDSFSMVCK